MAECRMMSIDPSRNRYRFYAMSIEPNLFGDHSLVVHWGRVGRPCSHRIVASGHAKDLNVRLGRVRGQKIKRGYEEI